MTRAVPPSTPASVPPSVRPSGPSVLPSAVPPAVLSELARTKGGEASLDHLVHDQANRRLLLLRALLDTVTDAAPARTTPAERRRAAGDWALLEAAEATGPEAAARVRALLLHPLTGPWARQTLAAVTAREPVPGDRERGLAHFGALAFAAAVTAGLPATAELTAHDGALTLPGTGTLRVSGGGPVRVTAAHTEGAIRLTPRGGAPVTVFTRPGHSSWSADAAWLAPHALPPLVPGARPVPLDDAGPYRAAPGVRHHSLSEPVTLDDASRKPWYESWAGTAPLLALGGAHRLTEAAKLLHSLVPLRTPARRAPEDAGGSCSATRKDAFGVVLASVPPGPVAFAALLVHELGHAKLSALGELTHLHEADPAAVYFAPWRPDPRPFDGLLQGIYSHLALAHWWQAYALRGPEGPGREHAWAEHARCHEMVAAALPPLVGSEVLTPEGRAFADGMVATHIELSRTEPPAGHLARARAYVDTKRAAWRRERERRAVHTTGRTAQKGGREDS
ncbi:aKG-HExxH-type peptide beta-hydroxylase [Streptomyces sp. SPB074]|uniref:aKG-HExxH-type peptide beta-hydroxylase n=1 Tax=Streptomyces sp. (strain SPB074) TaxID=465543 RepID=UPI00017F1833|nr:HEXXH motif-containing putative peptide modification protein [Streptomyces sp. SPB074]